MPSDIDLLSLEKLFEKCCAHGECFPNNNTDYFERYKETLRALREKIYPQINLGLALNSEEVGVYTDHGPEHFDEVVKYAGLILGLLSEGTYGDVIDAEDVAKGNWKLAPYEIYLLLLAIRFHDTGNIYGRDGHEKKILRVMSDIANAGLEDAVERRIIVKIAQAHGGLTSGGSKDTISEMEINTEHGSVSRIRLRKIAALVRIADEICENRNRAKPPVLVKSRNEIYHKYAESIYTNSLDNNELNLKFSILKKDAERKWGKGEDSSGEPIETYLTDEILLRLEKMELERRYCARFISQDIAISKIVVCINIYDVADEEYKDLFDEKIVLEDVGYPKEELKLSEKYKSFSGEEIVKLINPGTA